MSTSRRDFLKTTMIAGAGMALPAVAGAASNVPARQSGVNQLMSDAAAESGEYTRGIGIYPGSPEKNFSPTFEIDSSTYRNLALLRPAYHSSSYDYNLTAQLITDGIKDTKLPDLVSTSIQGVGTLAKKEREIFLDHAPAHTFEFRTPRPSVQIEIGSGDVIPAIDRVAIFVIVPDYIPADTLVFAVSTSDDGRLWKEMGSTTAPQPISPDNYPPDLVRRSQVFFPSVPLKQVCRNRYYKIDCSVSSEPARGAGVQWRMGQIAFYEGDRRVQIGGPYSFTSAWMSAGSGEEWVYVDLGARCEFDRVALYWIARPAEGSLQISDDASNWRDLQPLTGGTATMDDIRLSPSVRSRYVRVLMTRPTSPLGYLLSEFEVYGRGGPVARPKSVVAAATGRRLDLAGGAWRLYRPTPAEVTGESLSRPGFNDSGWMIATVPGTILTSYLNVGAIQDPNFGQNQLYISDSYFYSDFWYRTEFQAPRVAAGQRAWLNFDGINWKAGVFLNGEKIGRIEGGFMRGRFEVTGKLLAGKANALAVWVEKNDTPGSAKQKTFESPGPNGGALGADNPTYHASIGWDWIPTIRGRNTGIWGDVYLTTTGSVTIENPFVTTTLPLPDTSRADVSIEVELVNHHPKPVTGTFYARFGDVQCEQRITIEGSATRKIKLDPSMQTALRLQNPHLWWPVGYGDPYLYDVELTFEAKDKKLLDSKAFKVGVRQMSYSEEGSALRMWINGRRFIPRGGNWGFGESMLRYRDREYDAAVRYHREMNFTLIRNWVGQIGDEAFYEACDRHGVMVWQDFWLANPFDGPVPEDDALFMSNVRDYVLRIRNHASLGLYCGRNEWFPPKPLDAGIRSVIAELNPGLHYIGSSADEVVSGHGPYSAQPLVSYFRIVDPKLHSEIGMPAIPSIESIRAMMPESAIWPQGLDWGLHDFCLHGAQGGSSFRSIVEDSYGGAKGAEEWISLAQFLNYEGYRAMFEAQSKYRMGVLLWMSHPCWPSFVWQTYDYYFEPTSAYFGCKKGSEPLHIQWNRSTDAIEVVNYSAGEMKGLKAQAELLNMDGTSKWVKTASLDSGEDSTAACMQLETAPGLSPVQFLRLTLTRGEDLLSNNFYLRGLEEENYRAIRELPKAQVRATTKTARQQDLWLLTTDLINTSSTPALMTRLKVVREQSGDRILPVIYSDNYIALMPGEHRTIQTELKHADTRGENPRIVVGGFNISSV